MVSPTAADRIVIDDGAGGFREDLSGRPQMMIEVGDNQYAVLFNPLLENDGGPNGRFRAGRNESRPLRNGTRAMIPGPCSFWLRPGQRCEVRDAHELSASQYSSSRSTAPSTRPRPYYEVTRVGRDHPRHRRERSTTARRRCDETRRPRARRGQLIVIRGIDTQFYIPPTGVDIVPDTSVDESGATHLGRGRAAAPGPARAAAEPQPVPAHAGGGRAGQASHDGEQRRHGRRGRLPSEQMLSASPKAQDAQRARRRIGRRRPDRRMQSRAQRRQRVLPPETRPGPGAAPRLRRRRPPLRRPAAAVERLILDESRRPCAGRSSSEARQARLIRHAVVLGEKEYCVLVDADGKREIKVARRASSPVPTTPS